MNKTKIEWCDATFNPVTGCLHNCEYCYARKIANRFGDKCNDGKTHIKYATDIKANTYPWGFMPTLHPTRLNEPQSLKTPHNIFVCSMADLFGEWVPDEWIKAVFDACEKAPQHRYLFLTKNPKRYLELAEKGFLPNRENFWYGITMTWDCGTVQNCIVRLQVNNIFVSVEPITCKFENGLHLPYEKVQWVILGVETGNRKSKFIPEKKSLKNIVKDCKDSGISSLFMKDSLKGIWGEKLIQQYPWEVENAD